MFDIQVSIEAGRWAQEADLETLCMRVLEEAGAFLVRETAQPLPEHDVEISLLFTDDSAIRKINAEWRQKDKPTNVLSFPAQEMEPGDMPGMMLGDIIVAFETVEREAHELDKPFDEHLTHLLVHGFLHLFGFDHIEEDEALIMETLETRILVHLGLSDPYAGMDVVRAN